MVGREFRPEQVAAAMGELRRDRHQKEWMKAQTVMSSAQTGKTAVDQRGRAAQRVARETDGSPAEALQILVLAPFRTLLAGRRDETAIQPVSCAREALAYARDRVTQALPKMASLPGQQKRDLD